MSWQELLEKLAVVNSCGKTTKIQFILNYIHCCTTFKHRSNVSVFVIFPTNVGISSRIWSFRLHGTLKLILWYSEIIMLFVLFHLVLQFFKLNFFHPTTVANTNMFSFSLPVRVWQLLRSVPFNVTLLLLVELFLLAQRRSVAKWLWLLHLYSMLLFFFSNRQKMPMPDKLHLMSHMPNIHAETLQIFSE